MQTGCGACSWRGSCCAGAGSYYSAFPRYRGGGTGQGFYEHAHDDYLEFLTEYGILGTALPAAVILLALRNTILAMSRRRSQFARGIGFAALMAITAMLIHATVEFNLQIPAYAATFMVILATAWLSRYLRSENPPHPFQIKSLLPQGEGQDEGIKHSPFFFMPQ